MKYLLILLLSGCASSQFYIDSGIGYIEEVTLNQSVTISTPIGDSTIDSTIDLPIDSAFLLLRGGVKIDQYHIEVETIRNQERHFDTIRFYHRYYF